MNAFDLTIIEFLNGFARSSVRVDHLIMFVSGSNLLKGGLVVAVLWWLWFRSDEDSASRSHILATLAASIVAIIVARSLTMLLPFRDRPLQEPRLDFVLPHGVPADFLDTWTSFPSDHAVLFFALVVGIWFASRRVGLVALVYVILIISLPRIYLGLHYPTDIIAGAVTGAVVCTVFNLDRARIAIHKGGMKLKNQHPSIFYACFFLLTFQIAVLFKDLRDLVDFAARFLPI